jgi:glycine hydroxymethyltransferase
VNKNTVPAETQSPFVTSGVRIGTAALTTRGMREAEMRRVAELIDRVLRDGAGEDAARRAREDVRELASRFPLFAGVEEGVRA